MGILHAKAARLNSKSIETQCKLSAGNPPTANRNKLHPSEPQRHARHRQVALYLAPEADTGMVCGKPQVRQQSEPWGTRRIQTTSTLTVLNLVKWVGQTITCPVAPFLLSQYKVCGFLLSFLPLHSETGSRYAASVGFERTLRVDQAGPKLSETHLPLYSKYGEASSGCLCEDAVSELPRSCVLLCLCSPFSL